MFLLQKFNNHIITKKKSFFTTHLNKNKNISCENPFNEIKQQWLYMRRKGSRHTAYVKLYAGCESTFTGNEVSFTLKGTSLCTETHIPKWRTAFAWSAFVLGRNRYGVCTVFDSENHRPRECNAVLRYRLSSKSIVSFAFNRQTFS